LLSDAYIFGATSPNKTNKKVAPTVTMRKLIVLAKVSTEIKLKENLFCKACDHARKLSLENTAQMMVSDNIMIAILIALLLIKIVARSFLGFSFNRRILLLVLESSFLRVTKSFGLSEKKAISDPDINPERINNIIIKSINPESSNA